MTLNALVLSRLEEILLNFQIDIGKWPGISARIRFEVFEFVTKRLLKIIAFYQSRVAENIDGSTDEDNDDDVMIFPVSPKEMLASIVKRLKTHEVKLLSDIAFWHEADFPSTDCAWSLSVEPLQEYVKYLSTLII